MRLVKIGFWIRGSTERFVLGVWGSEVKEGSSSADGGVVVVTWQMMGGGGGGSVGSGRERTVEGSESYHLLHEFCHQKRLRRRRVVALEYER